MIKKFSFTLSFAQTKSPTDFLPKIQYELVAESANSADKLREANQQNLTFPYWCPGRDLNPHVLANNGF